ncbi:hypothetical protein [Streptomyces sp. NPDC051079]|uniref:hypothetical protein n=1 Tax=Streptomyces sp. NPDC051079 TaxID=3155043 RepID=UPI00344C0553
MSQNSTRSTRDRKTDSVIAVMLAVIIGFVAGTVQGVLTDVPVYTALETGCKAGGGAVLIAFACLAYVWNNRE